VERLIVLITVLPSVGQIPDLRKADWIFSSVKALSNTILNLGQKSPFVIPIIPIISSINLLISIE
jgi:hypothetical protein